MSPVRRSTRAKKKAVTFLEEQTIKENEKRKKSRANNDDEDSVASDESMEDVEDQEEEAMDQSSAAESEEEAAPPVSRKRKSPSSRRKVSAKSRTVTPAKKTNKKQSAVGKVGKNGPTRRQALTALKALAKKVFDLDEDTPETSLPVALLLCLNDNKKATGHSSFYTASLQKMAHELVEEYVQDSNETEIKLLNLIFTSAGATSVWKPEHRIEDLHEEEWGEALETVTNEMEETTIDKVLLTAAPSNKLGQQEYRKIYSEFWYQLGLAAANHTDDLQEDQRFLLDMFQSQLVELTEVKIPDIRFLLSLANYQIGLAMLDRSAELVKKIETAERQLKVAKRSKSTTKAKALESQIETWTKNSTDLEDLVGEIFTSLFTKRYRDSDPNTRKLSLESLTAFGKSRPDIFISSTYMKYFYWALYDKTASVRVSAMKGLSAPFQAKVETSTMKQVIEKSFERIVDCTRDIDLIVQDASMELLLLLLHSGFMEDTEVDEEVWSQINSGAIALKSTPKFRRDALYFVIGQLESFDRGPFRSEREASEQIEDIAKWLALQLLFDDDIPVEQVAYSLTDLVVASLRSMKEHKPLVCNWSAILRALQNDDRKKSGDQRIDTVKQRVMLRMLVASATFEMTDVASGLSVVDPKLVQAKSSAQEALRADKKQSKKDQTSHEDLTLALLRTLPDLLQSYKSENVVLQSLTELPQYFLTRVLGISTRKKEFKSLMKSLSNVFLDSADEVALSNTCTAMVALAKGNHARSSEALLALKSTATSLFKKLVDLSKQKQEIRENGVKDSGEKVDVEDLDIAMNLCLRRLAILSKRWPIYRLIDTGREEDEGVEAVSRAIADYLLAELKAREVAVNEEGTENETIEIPDIWTNDLYSAECHQVVASSVSEGLNFLVGMLAWRFTEELKDDTIEYDEDTVDNHIVLRMRKRVIQTILCCFEHYLDGHEEDMFSDEHHTFATDVNAHGWRVYGDLRALFPHKCAKSPSLLLKKVAIVQDKVLSGAGMRFMASQDYQLQENEEGSAEKRGAIQALLFPLARGLALNWETGNRMEANRIFRHATGSGKECHDFVLTVIRAFKKIEPLRLLEAIMTCLRVEWDAWSHRYPQEPGDHPTEAEMELYENQRAEHGDQFFDLLKLAGNLSSSLGVGKIKNKDLAHSMGIFFKNGVMISFAEEDGEPPGCRLTFLRVLAKFLLWAKRDKTIMKEISNTLDIQEAMLRQHGDFQEAFEDDLDALVDFRKAAGLDPIAVEEEDTVNARFGSTQDSGRIRMSSGSSVSTIQSKASANSGLESIEEGDEEEEESEDEMDATPSPSKRQRSSTQMSARSARSARSYASSALSSIDLDDDSENASDGSMSS